MVSTQLKNNNQIGSFPQLKVNNIKYLKPPPTCSKVQVNPHSPFANCLRQLFFLHMLASQWFNMTQPKALVDYLAGGYVDVCWNKRILSKMWKTYSWYQKRLSRILTILTSAKAPTSTGLRFWNWSLPLPINLISYPTAILFHFALPFQHGCAVKPRVFLYLCRAPVTQLLQELCS